MTEKAINVERRRWNAAKYEQKAKDREAYGDEFVDGKEEASGAIRNRPEFEHAEPGAAGPAGSKRSFLKSRQAPMGLDSDAGKQRIVTEAKTATGYHCDVCDCLLRDSASYLDHINGKKHQRALGFSMRVERVGVDAVRERFAEQKAKRQQMRRLQENDDNPPNMEDWEARLNRRCQEEEEEEGRMRLTKRLKKSKQNTKSLPSEEEDEEKEDDEQAAMNAMMGFGSFGGGSAKRR